MILILAAAAAATMQAQFDSASAAAEAGRCTEAVAGFDAIAARGVRSPTVGAVVALRRGRCLVQLGRLDEAAAALTTGLAAVGEAPDFGVDRALALVARGQIAYRRFDYPAATRDFAAARDLLPPAGRFEPLLWLARSTMFDPGDAARGYADAALAIVGATKTKPATVAHVHTLHARALINHGDVPGGYAELRRALGEQGGLTERVNADDITTRSDLAIAALLSRDENSARKYLAYTGAGHGTPFGSGADMEPPPCDGVDLRPDDTAIVEFGIGNDGAVAYATPVYASRLGPSAAAFARAVAGWSWKPEALAKIAPLFRLVTRVERRCSTTSAAPGVLDPLRRDLRNWLDSRGVAPFTADASDAASLPRARAELARRRAAGGDDIALVPVLVALGSNVVLAQDDRQAAFDEARTIAARHAAPVAVTTLLALAARVGDATERTVDAPRGFVRDLLATPAVAADPHSRSVLRLVLAQARYRAPAPPDAAALLGAVADDPALAEHDPLRSAARVRLASLLAQNGDLPAARAAFDASGVTAEQCALVDARPVAASVGVSENDFPKEALHWGFEGWVRLEFDVRADGRLADNRAIIAYPPFVFGPAAVATSRNWRYRQTFRPDGVAGCNGAQQQVRFRIG